MTNTEVTFRDIPVDPSLEDAARTVARPWHVATRILLPLSVPALSLGAFLVFILAFSELAVSMFLRVETYPSALFARLWFLQVGDSKSYAAQTERNRIRLIREPAAERDTGRVRRPNRSAAACRIAADPDRASRRELHDPQL